MIANSRFLSLTIFRISSQIFLLLVMYLQFLGQSVLSCTLHLFPSPPGAQKGNFWWPSLGPTPPCSLKYYLTMTKKCLLKLVGKLLSFNFLLSPYFLSGNFLSVIFFKSPYFSSLKVLLKKFFRVKVLSFLASRSCSSPSFPMFSNLFCLSAMNSLAFPFKNLFNLISSLNSFISFSFLSSISFSFWYLYSSSLFSNSSLMKASFLFLASSNPSKPAF